MYTIIIINDQYLKHYYCLKKWFKMKIPSILGTAYLPLWKVDSWSAVCINRKLSVLIIIYPTTPNLNSGIENVAPGSLKIMADLYMFLLSELADWVLLDVAVALIMHSRQYRCKWLCVFSYYKYWVSCGCVTIYSSDCRMKKLLCICTHFLFINEILSNSKTLCILFATSRLSGD